MNPKTRSVITAVIVFIAALAVRLLYVSHFKTTPLYDPSATGLDMLRYDKLARSIASGDWLGSGVFELMPGYGYFLGTIYTVFGHSLTAAYAMQALLGAATVVLVFWLTKRLVGERTAIIAAIISVLAQPLVFHAGMLTGEMLTVFFTVAFLLLLSIAIHKHNTWIFLLSGILAGFGTLCRGTFALFIILFIPWHLILERRNMLRRALPHVLALVVGAIIIVAPVTLRNYVLGDDLVLITAHDGINIYFGNNPDAHGAFQQLPGFGLKSEEMRLNSKRIAEESLGRELKPSEVSSYWKDKSFEFIRSQPKRFLSIASEKVLFFFNAFEVPDVISMQTMERFSWLLKYCLIPFGFIMPFAALGMVVAFRRKGFGTLYLFMAANLIAVIMTLVNSRYRLTSVPIFVIFAATALVWLKNNMRSKKRIIFGVVILLVSLAVVYKPISAELQPAESTYNLANAYLHEEKNDLAEEELKRAIEIDPNFIDARFRLGFLLWQQKRTDEAEKQFDAILKLNPNHVESLNQLGNISLYRDQNEKALEYWQRSLSINPDQPEVKEAIEHNKLK